MTNIGVQNCQECHKRPSRHIHRITFLCSECYSNALKASVLKHQIEEDYAHAIKISEEIEGDYEFS